MIRKLLLVRSTNIFEKHTHCQLANFRTGFSMLDVVAEIGICRCIFLGAFFAEKGCLRTRKIYGLRYNYEKSYGEL
jgi:hypothetical protein